jgi:lipoate-protein ligase A
MKLFVNHSLNPYFNLAAEEYLIDHTSEDIILLWRNASAVIIGKNQNAFAQINLDFTRAHGIAVVRRLTGGGAVFHDPGNINFTFISPPHGALAEGIREGGLDFAHFAAPVIDALRGLGVEASLSGRNDIMADGRKISGNAQCVRNGVTMHHGTLLFSADVSAMQGALSVDPSKLRAKGIDSVRSRVANLCELLPTEHRMDAPAFMAYLVHAMEARYGVTAETFTAEMCAGIQTLADEKYASDAWNLQRFGSFGVSRRKRFPFGSIELELTVCEGKIDTLAIGGDFFGMRDVNGLAEVLCGTEYDRAAVTARLADIPVDAYISGCTAAELVCVLFDTDAIH